MSHRVFTEQPGKDFDAGVLYDPLPGDHLNEVQQGYHEETILHQMEDDDFDFARADWTIGDLEHILCKHNNRLLEDLLIYIRILRANLKKARTEHKEEYQKERA